MASKQIHHFGTREDYLPVLAEFEASGPMKYILMGLQDDPDFATFHSGAELPDLGVSTSGDYNLDATYLVLQRDIPADVQTVPQRRGGIKYAMDQLTNPTSFTFHSGGVYASDTVIAGWTGTCSDDAVSVEMYNHCRKRMRRHFTLVREFWIGPAALEMLRAGARFTQGVKNPRKLDLTADWIREKT